jgi:tetratricopeptide (TPR) repeat protein
MRKPLAFAVAVLGLGGPLLAGEKLKPPATPFTIFVYATPEYPGPPDLTVKGQKELVDSAKDLRKHIVDKRKQWMRLVSRPEEAEIVLEIQSRGQEPGHGYVLAGHVQVLDQMDARIIGQGGLNPEQIFNIWRDAAWDMAWRVVQHVLSPRAAALEAARARGVRPWMSRVMKDADAKFEAGQWQEAIVVYDKVLTSQPGSAHARYRRAAARLKLGQGEAALADLDEAIKLEPGLAPARVERARLHLASGRLQPAIEDFDAAEQTGLKDPALYLERGKAHLALARQGAADPASALRLAVNDLSEVLAREPANAAVVLLRAEAQARRGSLAEAVDDYSKAIAAGQGGNEALLHRGLCQARLGKNDPAIADMSAVIAADPSSAVAYWSRADLYKKKGLATKAAADRKKAQALDPAIATRTPAF